LNEQNNGREKKHSAKKQWFVNWFDGQSCEKSLLFVENNNNAVSYIQVAQFKFSLPKDNRPLDWTNSCRDRASGWVKILNCVQTRTAAGPMVISTIFWHPYDLYSRSDRRTRATMIPLIHHDHAYDRGGY